MFIDPIEFSVFLLLQQNPLKKISEIAEQLEITFYRANKAYNALFEKKLIKGISSIIDPVALNLERVEVIYYVERYKSLVNLEKLLELHNYTRYQTRFISGSKRGVYAQFDLPRKSIKFLNEMSNTLKEKERVLEYRILEKGRTVATTGIDINFIDLKTLEWKFDLQDWFEKEINEEECKEELPTKEKKERDDPKLNKIDLWIMRTLSKNANMSNKEIKKDIEKETEQLLHKKLVKDLSTISRRLQIVKERYIAESQLQINNNLFNLSTQIMFEVEISEIDKRILCLKMRESPLPFKSALTETEKGFRWIIRCPSEYVSELTNYIWKLQPSSMRVNYLIPNSKLYWFYPLNYDVKKGKWIDTFEHFFNPIQEVL
ncbi:MAG: hypothetical protein ACTSUR_05185 [Candidatus Heimdallarchaeaceae archaeon]